MITPARPSSSRRTRVPPWLFSVRAAMILLIILATIVPLGVIVRQSIHGREQAYRDGRSLSERMADRVASEQQLLLSSAEQLMSAFAYLPAVRRRDAGAVNFFLADLVRKNPQITNLAVADEKGNMWASGLPMKTSINVSDRRYFINALATGRFSSGEFNIGRIRNRPALLFGYPIRDEAGRITGVAIVSFSLGKYERYFQEKELDADASLALLDRKGTFLFTRPTTDIIGQQDKEDLLRKMISGPDKGTFEGTGRTGVRRIFAYRKLRLSGESQPYMYVRTGVAVSSIRDRNRKEFLLGIGSIGGGAILILLASVLIGKRFVLDKITALKEATERISRGELGSRVPEVVSGGELGDLGDAINRMSLRLQESDAERRQADAERSRLTAAIEQAGETVVITDSDGKIQYVNPAFERTTGYSRQEAIGQNPRLLKSGKQDEEFYSQLWGTISGARTWEGRMVNKRKDGVFYTEDATISPVFDGTGRIVNYVAVKRDITEHLRLAEQFQQSQKMESVGRLAGGVAHDFNNLLTVINGYSELLLQKIGKESPLHGDVEEIKRAGERAATLTQQLLAFSRKQIVEPKVVRLDLLVAEMQGMLPRLIGEDISIQITTGKGLGSVKVDPGQFQQILMNLSVNAKDAMSAGGKIAIETANVELDEGYCASHPYVTPGRYVMLSFSDTGTGMSAEVKGHIFEPFFTTKERGSGTGLGLATTYGAVHQAGGSIEVYSEVGIGTTFKIYLPRVEAEVVKPVEDGRSTDLPGGTETVLVVEDEESVGDVCVQILERLGYKVLQARNGSEAIAVAQGYGDRIDLLLTDVVMPGMNGGELAAHLAPLHQEMKVLFTSGYTDAAIVRHGVLDEGVSFIGKPYSPSALARKIRDVLDRA